jgi:predicted DNA-binding transcriptional regulator AlpA
MTRLLRFRDLKERGVIRNWPTLKNRIDRDGFPPGRMTGPNERTWTETEVEAWISSRPVARKPVPRRRPRKAERTAVEA